MKHTLAALLILAGALAVTTIEAKAQAMPTMKRPGAYVAVGGGYSLYKLSYGQQNLEGIMAYVDVNLRPHYGFEGEARWLNMGQTNDVHATTFLAGPRVTLREPYRLGPYLKVLAGEGKFNFPYNYATGNYFVVAPGGGVDWSIGHRLRVRVVDFEYQLWPQFPYGTFHSLGASAGMSYSFP